MNSIKTYFLLLSVLPVPVANVSRYLGRTSQSNVSLCNIKFQESTKIASLRSSDLSSASRVPQ